MPLQIIRAGVANAAQIATVGKKSFRRSFEHLFNSREELFEYLEHTYDPVKLAKSLRKENNFYFLAWLNGEVVGFAKVKLNSLNDQIESIAQMELQKIYVLPEKHGYGVGTALMNEVKNLAREVCPDYIWLDTHTSNEKAIGFYEKNGFNKIGKYYFTIGTQVFEYHLMALPVAIKIRAAC
ncbi:MAG TPA: GNAT family N-acetyltransferase [Chitinophagaceae bacterium]